VRDVAVFGCRWRLVQGERVGSRFSRDRGSWRRHLWGWSPVSMGDGSSLAKRRRRLGKKKEGLSSFGQKARGMTERGMREVMVGKGLSSFGLKAEGMTERGMREVVVGPL